MRFGYITSTISALLTSLAAIGVASPVLQDRVASFQGGNAEHDATTKYFQIRSRPSVEDGEEGLSDDSAGNTALEEFKRSPQSGEGGEEGSPDDSAGNSALEEFKRSPQSAEGGEEGLSEESARISVLLEFER